MTSASALPDDTDYYLGPVLGRAVTGFVYEGFSRRDGRDVVIKVLSKKLARYPEVMERLACDIEDVAMAGLEHRSITQTLGVVQIEQRRAVVMDKAPGEPLATILAEHGPVTDRRALKLVLQVAQGLRAAAACGVCHGDLRPAKLHVDQRGRLWITDFGMAATSCVGARFRKYANIPFGHPEYLAPEVVQQGAQQPTEAADLYALGITLYELVCGVVPFRGISARNTLQYHLDEQIPPPPEGIEVGQGVADLIMALTAKDPERRLTDLGELVRRLKACLRGGLADEMSLSQEDWQSMSGRLAAPVVGWDAQKLNPESPMSRPAVEQEFSPEEMLQPGDFQARTGFFKPRASDDRRLRDPFRPARRTRSLGDFSSPLARWRGRAGVLEASVALNLLLLLLIASLGLGGASSSAPAGRGERADAARERARSPRQLALRLSESLLADPELVTVEPKLVLLSEERAFFNLQRLPTCAAGAEAAERASVIAERRRLVAKTGALLRALRPALVAVTHAPIEQRAELRLSHREALRLALRRFAISGAVEGSAARAQGLELLAELGARVGGAGDAYFLALAWAELGDEAAALRWLGEAFERGYRDLEQLGAEPAFASVRQRPGYRRLIDRLRPRGD